MTWWLELRAILWVKDPWKLAHKIWASFSIPEVRMRATPGQGYTALPTPRCLDRNTFLLDDLLHQDIWQQPVLLMIAYVRGLQYWAEKHNPLENPDTCSLAGGVIELREAVREYVTFTRWIVFWDLGWFTKELQTSGPKPPCLADYCHHRAMNLVSVILALQKLSPKLLPQLLPMWTWPDVQPHHLEQKERTIICWLSLPL